MPAERTPRSPRRRGPRPPAPPAHPSAGAAPDPTPGQIDLASTGLDACDPDEPEDIWPAYSTALAVVEELADEADAALAASACPPHHWLIQDGLDPDTLLLTCVRCAAEREQPRAPEPDQRTWAERARRNAPAPSFGQG